MPLCHVVSGNSGDVRGGGRTLSLSEFLEADDTESRTSVIREDCFDFMASDDDDPDMWEEFADELQQAKVVYFNDGYTILRKPAPGEYLNL